MTKIIYTYAILMVIFTFIAKKDIKINNIIYKNFEGIQNEVTLVEREELGILKFVKDNKIDKNLYINAPRLHGRASWLISLYNNQFIYIDSITGYYLDIDAWLETQKQKYYLSYYKENDKMQPDNKSDKYKIIYKDKYGYILERQN